MQGDSDISANGLMRAVEPTWIQVAVATDGDRSRYISESLLATQSGYICINSGGTAGLLSCPRDCVGQVFCLEEKYVYLFETMASFIVI